MTRKIVSLITTVSTNGIIGLNNIIPWFDRDALDWFHECTRNKTVIFGSKTYDAVVPKIKTGTQHYRRWSTTGACLEDLIDFAQSHEVFIAGGAQLYKYAIDNNLIDRYYIHQHNQNVRGDTYFPHLTFGKNIQEIDKNQLDLPLKS